MSDRTNGSAFIHSPLYFFLHIPLYILQFLLFHSFLQKCKLLIRHCFLYLGLRPVLITVLQPLYLLPIQHHAGVYSRFLFLFMLAHYRILLDRLLFKIITEKTVSVFVHIFLMVPKSNTICAFYYACIHSSCLF